MMIVGITVGTAVAVGTMIDVICGISVGGTKNTGLGEGVQELNEKITPNKIATFVKLGKE